MVDIYGGTSTGGLANFNNTLARLAEQNRQAPYEAEKLNAMKRTGELAGMNLNEEKRKQQGLIQAQNLQPIPGETPEMFQLRQWKLMEETGNSSANLQGLAKTHNEQKNAIYNDMMDTWTKSGKNKFLWRSIMKQKYPDKSQWIDAIEVDDETGDIVSTVYVNGKLTKKVVTKGKGGNSRTDLFGVKPEKVDKPKFYTQKEVDDQLYPLVTNTITDKKGKVTTEYDQRKLFILQQKYRNYLKQGMSSPDAMDKVKSEEFPEPNKSNFEYGDPTGGITSPNQNPSVFNQPNWKPPGPPTTKERVMYKGKPATQGGLPVYRLDNGKYQIGD